MQANTKILQVISIQHELAMSIGLALDFEKMVDIFMRRAQQRLSLLSVTILHITPTQKKINSSYSYPQIKECLADKIEQHALSIGFTDGSGLSELSNEGQYLYFFKIPNIGVLILERQNQVIDAMVLHALTPIMGRLSTSCLASLEHQNLKVEVEARTKAEQKLIAQSFVDSLTNLPNRKMLYLSLEKALANSKRKRVFGAVFVMNVDRFKIINDSVGHATGDKILKALGERLQDNVRQGDIISRIGGDEFVLLINDLDTTQQKATTRAKTIAEHISREVSQELSVSGHKFNLSLSIGINLFPSLEDQQLNNRELSQGIIKNADLAMHEVKSTSRNSYRFFSDELMAFSEQQTNIETHLKLALKRHEFELYFQPLVSVNHEIVGAEALLRWQSKELGWVSPAEFIPVAEDCGLILDIGDWVIDSACQLIVELQERHAKSSIKYISVNVSPLQFKQADFASKLLAKIQQYNIPAQRLRVEITEGVAIDDIELTINKMNLLRERGVAFMLDDFGSGYSSLSYLHKLPLQTIKIDRSFTQDVDSNSSNQVITGAILDICEHFSLECIIEGVETIEEFTYFENKTLTAIQGYYFYKPLAITDLLGILK